MDIVPKIKFSHLKASFETLRLKQKFFLLLFLFSLIATLLPHEAYAFDAKSSEPVLVFDLRANGYEEYLLELNTTLTDAYYKEQLLNQAWRQVRLTEALKQYLIEHNSPLAEYASTLITLRNWKKIIALSNAESTMCRRYPIASANCWGVGGADLWDMGDNLGEGVVAMNQFLNKHPLRSPVKYANMPFERMNGLYKQPPGQHWVDNNTIIYRELEELEAGIE